MGLGSLGRLGRFKPYACKIRNGSHVQTQQGTFEFTWLDVNGFENHCSSLIWIPLGLLSLP